MSSRVILLIAEAEDGLMFFQSFVVPRESIADLGLVERRIAEYLENRGARLRQIDRADVVEIDYAKIPEGWLANASPADEILACGGRTWVDPALQDEAATKGLRGWFRRVASRIRRASRS